jgi:predicted transcriptional regulator
LNEGRICKDANIQHFKSSDVKKIGADAKILTALINHQPLTRLNLCKEANINESTFYRHKRVLENSGIIKETKNGYCLWNFVERPTLWQRMIKNLKEVNGDLIVLRFYRLNLVGPPDPITGWFKNEYHKYVILGIFIHKGAIELEKTAEVTFTGENNAAVLTQALVDPGDVIWFQDFYVVTDVKPIYDGVNLSYRIVWLKKAPQYGSLLSL